MWNALKIKSKVGKKQIISNFDPDLPFKGILIFKGLQIHGSNFSINKDSPYQVYEDLFLILYLLDPFKAESVLIRFYAEKR